MKKSELRQIIREELNRITELRQIIREELNKITENTIIGVDISRLLKGINVGFTKIKLDRSKTFLTISHGGNMGNSIKDSVNPNLKRVGIPNVETLKKMYPSHEEAGSPDYMYTIKFNIKKK